MYLSSHRSLMRLIIYIFQIFTASELKIKYHSSQRIPKQFTVAPLYSVRQQRVHNLVGGRLWLGEAVGDTSGVDHAFCAALGLGLGKGGFLFVAGVERLDLAVFVFEGEGVVDGGGKDIALRVFFLYFMPIFDQMHQHSAYIFHDQLLHHSVLFALLLPLYFHHPIDQLFLFPPEPTVGPTVHAHIFAHLMHFLLF